MTVCGIECSSAMHPPAQTRLIIWPRIKANGREFAKKATGHRKKQLTTYPVIPKNTRSLPLSRQGGIAIGMTAYSNIFIFQYIDKRFISMY